MSDPSPLQGLSLIDHLSPEMKSFFNETRNKLKGYERRQFMVQVVSLLGYGGQLRGIETNNSVVKSSRGGGSNGNYEGNCKGTA